MRWFYSEMVLIALTTKKYRGKEFGEVQTIMSCLLKNKVWRSADNNELRSQKRVYALKITYQGCLVHKAVSLY